MLCTNCRHGIGEHKTKDFKILCRACFTARKLVLQKAATKKFREKNREVLNKKAAQAAAFRRANFPEKVAQEKQKYYRKNKDKILAQDKKYRIENTAEIRKKRKLKYAKLKAEGKLPKRTRTKYKDRSEYYRRWHSQNKDRIRMVQKRYEQANREKIAAKKRRLYPKYYARNKHKIIVREQQKVQKVKQATPKWVNVKELEDFYANCPPGHNVDHIIPLIHPDVCGLNVPWNLQYLSEKDNKSKSNKFDGTYENKNWHKMKAMRRKLKCP